MRPAIEHGCGKQTPNNNLLLFRVGLLDVFYNVEDSRFISVQPLQRKDEKFYLPIYWHSPPRCLMLGARSLIHALSTREHEIDF